MTPTAGNGRFDPEGRIAVARRSSKFDHVGPGMIVPMMAVRAIDITLNDAIVIACGTPMLQRKVEGADSLRAGLGTILAEVERAHPEFPTGCRDHTKQGVRRSKTDLLDRPHREIATPTSEFERSVTEIM